VTATVSHVVDISVARRTLSFALGALLVACTSTHDIRIDIQQRGTKPAVQNVVDVMIKAGFREIPTATSVVAAAMPDKVPPTPDLYRLFQSTTHPDVRCAVPADEPTQSSWRIRCGEPMTVPPPWGSPPQISDDGKAVIRALAADLQNEFGSDAVSIPPILR
jgi:hypothetical protein